MSKETKVFKVLANSRRLKIMEMLLAKERLSVSTISHKLNLSFKSTSRHLCLLENSGLLEREQEGLFAFYKIKKDLKAAFKKLLEGMSVFV
ncbi:MAG: metalloregulator ArsR/SmtB family transcription factor [Candidatus Omnitrophica bacterium]|jgi:ArsR family transcriptional regulator|nr:metalloregulator ArsR/SmtB family transcription factor [Candidatus Omnitrophota bacterium]